MRDITLQRWIDAVSILFPCHIFSIYVYIVLDRIVWPSILFHLHILFPLFTYVPTMQQGKCISVPVTIPGAVLIKLELHLRVTTLPFLIKLTNHVPKKYVHFLFVINRDITVDS